VLSPKPWKKNFGVDPSLLFEKNAKTAHINLEKYDVCFENSEKWRLIPKNEELCWFINTLFAIIETMVSESLKLTFNLLTV